MLKIIYFDVEDYERNYLVNANNGKFDYRLVEMPLNNVLKKDYDLLDAEVISVFTSSRLNNDVLKQFKKLKVIALRSVGFNHVDLDYCNRNGILVLNTPNYGNKSVSEFAFGLMLDVCRKITKSANDYREMNINPLEFSGVELSGKTVGIFGLGAIGKEFAKLCFGFDMKILAFDVKENDYMKKQYSIEYTSFDNLLKESDFISLHAPLTNDNFHKFDDKAFKLMKANAILINTARGELIDTQSLFKALKQKEIAGVGLDVLESEEYVSEPDYLLDINRLNKNSLRQTILNSHLMQLDNVIITPHVAYNTQEAIHRILKTTIENITSYANGIVINNVNSIP